MRRTAIYMRVSTQAQAQEGDSLAAQREALLSYINAHQDLVLAGEYMDDGISGQKYEQRDELQRMLADVKAGKIDLIICTKLDRLHRSLKHFLDMQEILDRYNVSWLCIWEPMYDTSTPAGQLIINQMMSFAQFEAQNTGVRIRQVMDYKISQGEVASGTVPCGYRIEGRRLVIDEAVAPYVREAFEYYSRSGCLQRTVAYCYGMPGLPAFHPGFKRMLQNRKYIGEHRGNPNFCPPIIDKDLFEDVQRKLGINIKISQVRTYVFSGLAVCGECSRRLATCTQTRRRRRGEDKKQTYYKCPGHYRQPRVCDSTASIREEVLEAYMIGHIRDEISQYLFSVSQADAPRQDNRKKASDIQRKMDRLKDLYINDLITLEEYKADKEKYQKDLDTLSAEPMPEPVDTSALERLLSRDIGAYYQTLSKDERRYFWRSIIKEIRISSTKQITIIFL